MTGTDPEVGAAVADAHRREWAFVLAATARVARDIDVAEECVQDAYVAALDAWSRQGIPRNPGAWLTTTARRRALDAQRRDRTLRAKLPLLIEPGSPAGPAEPAAATRPRRGRPRTRGRTRSPTTGFAWCSPAATQPWPGRRRWR